MAKPVNDPMSSGPPADELETLLERLCLGELAPAEWSRLGDLIRGDQDAAMRYVETAHYCETLRNETAGAEPLPAMLRSAVARDGGKDYEPSSSLRSRGPLAWFAPWAVAVSVAFLCGWLASGAGSTPSPATPAPPQVMPKTFVLSEDAGRSEPMGRITGLTPVASSDGLLRSLKVGSQLGRGEVFQLTRGAARLEIGRGEVLIQGPAEVSPIGDNTLFVRSGRVTVSHGDAMTIQTPSAVIVGQSARFAVVANAEVGLDLSVIEGEATVHSAPRRGRVGESLGKVAAGENVQVFDAGSRRYRIRSGAALPEGVLLAWSDATEKLHPYEQLVLADKPLAYWPLYRVRRHRAVLDLTQNGFDGYAIGNWPTELTDVHASQPRGSYFDGESYVESDRKPPVDLRTGFTIESWARVAGGPEYQSVFTSRWVLESHSGQEQCLGFTLYAGENDRWQFWTGSGEYGKNWDKLDSNEAVQRNRWTHVAASFQPDAGQENATASIAGVVRVFVDGALAGEARHSMSLEDFAWPARIGAAEFVPKSLTSWLFEGELRDVALYDHVLQPGQVRTHAEQGKSAT
ncbi:hypothetical protein Pla108_40150 [Botrimarina colliarenosi]|uniref:FecR protein n=1 Tax=Botrimarina colliarenosi TaxID=2528001 RepID=A0A5C6A0F3_9BACT|nr:LamG domain-containing protein [Botrimarina colliarenosi]TWT92875.1 hypothetical protein Pla108_40150 [Botrimarina colliarenosi]